MARPALSAQDVDAFRQKACDAVVAMLAKGGRADISLRQLGDALGCSHATPYRYFASREELFMAVRATCFRRFGEFMHKRLKPHTEPMARIHAVSRAYADYAVKNPAEFRLMFELGQPQPEQFPEFHQVGVQAWKIVESVVEDAVDAGCLTGDPTDIAHMLWASVHGLVSLHAAGRLTVGRNVRQLLKPMVQALCEAHGGSDGA